MKELAGSKRRAIVDLYRIRLATNQGLNRSNESGFFPMVSVAARRAKTSACVFSSMMKLKFFKLGTKCSLVPGEGGKKLDR
uniref:Uncharacterized protein n=1 Tax=Utricularia reniformis TaxID=192314 RepID=A0A1Y0AZT9_9LAMI|nr:hypothetical protein AEK19_MT0382 [Utricularia reniformis]ART30654.1 hypothetical protein AEK19_MT0382 [Utricularia reniformis]